MLALLRNPDCASCACRVGWLIRPSSCGTMCATDGRDREPARSSPGGFSMTPHYTALASCLLTALLAVSPVYAQPAAAPEASKPIPPVQPVPSTVPGRPDIPN